VPISSSSSRIEWLIAEGETLRLFAALLKLRSSATARKTDSALTSLDGICEFYSQVFVDLRDFSTARFTATLVLEGRKAILLQHRRSA
jgi:hypothetical protein